MKKDFRLGIERLDQLVLLSTNPWYIDNIRASEVWSQIDNANTKPIVAIVDSGIDLNHDEFKNSLWTNQYDKVDGIDNDGNGYVDDIHGWDFVQNDNSPQDGLFHGTHVAGIVSKIGNGQIQIMPLRFQDNNGLGYLGAASMAINYAVDMKLKGHNIIAINCSFGGLDGMSDVLPSAIRRANDNGIVVVLAAGNNGVDMDVSPKYPGVLSYTNSITVGAINSDGSLAGYSNYGKNSVTVAAPGSDVYSSLPNNVYGYVSGTSMAAPMVTSAVGLLRSFGNYSATQIKNAIMQGCSSVVELMDRIKYGALDIAKSLGVLKTMVQEQTKPVVVVNPSPPVSPIAPVVVFRLNARFDIFSGKQMKGWANISNSSSKAVVQIYINNVLRYNVRADQYRYDTRRYDGFNVSINRKFLNLRSNLLEVRIKDPLNRANQLVYKSYVGR